MRIPLLIAGVVIGLGSMSFQPAAACNSQGYFCSYPRWAALAFTGSTRGGIGSDVPSYNYGYVAAGTYGYAALGHTQHRYPRPARP